MFTLLVGFLSHYLFNFSNVWVFLFIVVLAQWTWNPLFLKITSYTSTPVFSEEFLRPDLWKNGLGIKYWFSFVRVRHYWTYKTIQCLINMIVETENSCKKDTVQLTIQFFFNDIIDLMMLWTTIFLGGSDPHENNSPACPVINPNIQQWNRTHICHYYTYTDEQYN